MTKWVQFVVKGRPSRWQRTTEHEGARKNTAAHERAKKNIVKHAWVAMRRARLKPFEGPVRLTVLAVYPRNKDCPVWASEEAWATGRRLYLKKDPDLDNLAKLVFDSIQPQKARQGWPRPPPFCIGDDNQVCSLVADKVIAAEGEKPCTVVIIEELGECYNEQRAGAANTDPKAIIEPGETR